MKKKGFTLIELMVVVVIIGILAAIAIPNFVKVIARAKESSVKANMHTLQVAVETANVDSNGTYPTTSADWESLGAYIPQNFRNPYNQTAGLNKAYENQNDAAATDTGKANYNGIGGQSYRITGSGQAKILNLTLMPGTT